MYLFEGHLILSLDAKWLELFGIVPNFTVSVEDNRLILKSSSFIKTVGKSCTTYLRGQESGV